MDALENGAADNRCYKEKHSVLDQVKVETAVNKVKSPGGAALIVKSMQSEKPRWGCNDS